MKLEDIKNKFNETEVHFYPWIGDQYFSNGNLKKLILGESHYGGSPEIVEQELTFRCIDEVQSNTWRNSFFTRVKNICIPLDSTIDHGNFWKHVAYYNFVQQIVGAKARVRPTDEMWKKSATAFLEVCNKLEPEIVIILGSELRTQMQSHNLISVGGPLYSSQDKKFYTGSIQLPNTTKIIRCICITHPSSPQFGKLIGWQNALNDYFLQS